MTKQGKPKSLWWKSRPTLVIFNSILCNLQAIYDSLQAFLSVLGRIWQHAMGIWKGFESSSARKEFPRMLAKFVGEYRRLVAATTRSLLLKKLADNKTDLKYWQDDQTWAFPFSPKGIMGTKNEKPNFTPRRERGGKGTIFVFSCPHKRLSGDLAHTGDEGANTRIMETQWHLTARRSSPRGKSWKGQNKN